MHTYRLWVRQRPEPVVVLLSRCVPQAQVYWFPIHHHIGRVIVKAVKEQAEISQSFSHSMFRKGCVCACAAYTVGMYSPGKAFVV